MSEKGEVVIGVRRGSKASQGGGQRQLAQPEKTNGLKRNSKQKLLKLVRANKSLLLSLGLAEEASDVVIYRALNNAADLDLTLKASGVSPRATDMILQLLDHSQMDQDLAARVISRRCWYMLMAMLLFLTVCLAIVAVVYKLNEGGWQKAKCSLNMFQNRSCAQGNTCLFSVSVMVDSKFLVAEGWRPQPEETSDTLLTGVREYPRDGPFRCCNNFSPNMSKSDPGWGAGLGCCDWMIPRDEIFCDNFGLLNSPHHRPGCPASPWDCGVTLMPGERPGSVQIDRLQVWEEPPTMSWAFSSVATLAVLVSVCILGKAAANSERLYGLADRCFWQLVDKLYEICWNLTRCCFCWLGPRRSYRRELDEMDPHSPTNITRMSIAQTSQSSWAPSDTSSGSKPHLKVPRNGSSPFDFGEGETMERIHEMDRDQQLRVMSPKQQEAQINRWSIEDELFRKTQESWKSAGSSRPATTNAVNMLKPLIPPKPHSPSKRRSRGNKSPKVKHMAEASLQEQRIALEMTQSFHDDKVHPFAPESPAAGPPLMRANAVTAVGLGRPTA